MSLNFSKRFILFSIKSLDLIFILFLVILKLEDILKISELLRFVIKLLVEIVLLAIFNNGSLL